MAPPKPGDLVHVKRVRERGYRRDVKWEMWGIVGAPSLLHGHWELSPIYRLAKEPRGWGLTTYVFCPGDIIPHKKIPAPVAAALMRHYLKGSP